MRPRPEALALGSSWKLALARTPPRGPAGEKLGRTTGSSLDFHDRRSYEAGDDVRNLDWRAFARTDQLLVRQWRDEVLARVEILVDASRSMGLDPVKAQLTLDLAGLLARAALESGAQPVIVRLEERPRALGLLEFERDGLAFDSNASLAESLRAAAGLCRSGAIVIVVSDFLAPHDAGELIRPVAARAGALGLVQVLSDDEAAPPVGGAHRLIDCETGEALDLVLDAKTVGAYLERLGRLGAALDEESRRARGRFVPLRASLPLERLCRERLAPEGLLEPAN